MDIDREVTPDPDLVTPATDPTPEPEDRPQSEEALEAVEDLLPEPKPVDGPAPLP